MKALLVYWSVTGNTEKVADAIEKGLVDQNIEVTKKVLADASEDNFCNYDLVFLGSPTYMFMPPEPVIKFIKGKLKMHSKCGDIKLKSPRLPGKKAVVFVTYSGPHTGENEAVPVGKYIGQMFEHIGFEVAEWYIAGEFHGHKEMNINGALGDIRGKPNERDLAKIKGDVATLVKSISLL